MLRSGDTLVIPKAPNFVLVSGAVYDETAVTYRPGRSAKWYLSQAGGPTQLADKKSIFVVRADGSIVGGGSFRWAVYGQSVKCGSAARRYGRGSGEGHRTEPEVEDDHGNGHNGFVRGYIGRTRGQVLRNELGPVRRFGTKLFFSLIILAMLGTTLRAQNSAGVEGQQLLPDETDTKQLNNADNFTESRVGFSLLKNIALDQKTIWTSPFHLRWADGTWLIPVCRCDRTLGRHRSIFRSLAVQ